MTELSSRGKPTIGGGARDWRVVGDEGLRREVDIAGHMGGRSPWEERNVIAGH